MRFVVGTVEGLLALLCIVTLVRQFLSGSGGGGAVGFAGGVVILALGGWLAKLAIGNFRSPAPKAESPN